ncbi:cardiolipin synthase [Paenibacillus thermotolerans]|uniref:cardiolipin synthase n=1 Tax=Paenibacillus thermotolerans TaxID=3027807 RepID=UPI0023685E9B|nr:MULTISPECIES: cardiolipin synthase [unclassified Paenibacillus]
MNIAGRDILIVTPRRWRYLIWLVIILLLYLFQIVTIVIAEFRQPSKAVAWLAILFAFPLVGFIMYYFLAKEYRRRNVVRRKTRAALEEERRSRLPEAYTVRRLEDFPNPAMLGQERLFNLLQSIPEAAITKRNMTEVLSSAEDAYRHMLEDIGRAKDHIHFLYYIWNDDDIGRTFQEALIRKALEGVKVRIIYDGIGSYSTRGAFWNELRAAGAEVKCFLPVRLAFFDKRVNYRNHRKITIVDGRLGYIGGINIGDEYLGKDMKLGYWRDTCLKIAGDGVYGLQRQFVRDWRLASGERLKVTHALFPEHGVPEKEALQIIPGGPDMEWDAILEMLFSAFTTAKERILVTTPYFIPDRSILMALKTAALSGVDVRLVIPGVADSRITLWASLSYLEELLQSGVKVYRYQNGFLHAKVFVVDRHFASVGTANMDMRSLFSNFEINAAVYDSETIEKLAGDFYRDIENSEEVMLKQFLKRPRLHKAQEAVGRLLAPLL